MGSTKYAPRNIPKISLQNFSSRIQEVTDQLIHAAETEGFFAITNHGIDSSLISTMFSTSASFFSLPDSTKATLPLTTKNAGWEKNAQIRPSTGAADQKESFQMQFGSNMDGLWPSDEVLPGFKVKCLKFMHAVQEVSEKLMLCFARGLGFPDDFFIAAHNVSRPNAQTVCRLLHYFAVDNSSPIPEDYYRAGAHADWDFVTLLFQKAGQSGLEICPGRETSTSFGIGDTWTKVEPDEGEIICNIGDLLMSWSDDRFKSTFHRVKTPREADDYFGERYSIAFFNQPCADVEIQGPKKKYPMVTGAQFTKAAMMRNFAALQAKKEELKGARENAAYAIAV